MFINIIISQVNNSFQHEKQNSPTRVHPTCPGIPTHRGDPLEPRLTAQELQEWEKATENEKENRVR